jgi:flagellar biosynthesis component FlhA
MKEKILNYLKENLFTVVTVSLIVIMVVIPLPALLVEILIALNIILALTLVTVLYTEKVKNIAFYPTLVLLSTVLGLAIYVSATRLILSKGAEYDGVLIKYFSSLIVGSEKENLIKGLVMFIVIIAFNVIIITKSCTRVSEVAARFMLDTFEVKLMAIDTEYSSGAITEDEAQDRKKEVQEKSDFYGTMDGVSKFVSGNEKIRIIIFMISFIGVILIGTFLKGESISNTINSYYPLIISSGILCMLPAFLVSLGMGIITSRLANSFRKKKFKRNPDNEIRLELGVGFLSIVSEKLDNNLLTGIQKLREDTENEYGICMPGIHIVDDPAINDYEYTIIFYGKNIGTFKLEKEDIKNSFNPESITIILTNLKTIIINNLEEILINDYSNQILKIKEKYPELFKHVLKEFSLNKIRIILSNILSEKKSLANMEKILELILLYSVEVKDIKIISDMIIKNI